MIRPLLSAALGIAAATPAWAQETPPQNPATPPAATQDPSLAGKGIRPGEQQTTAQDQPQSPVERWQKTNAVGRTLRSLRDDGVTLSLDYIGDTVANPVGGIREKVANSFWVDAGVDLDLDRLAGLSDTRVHIQAAHFGGLSLSQIAIGNTIAVQQSYRPVRETFLTQLNIEKDFLNRKLNVMVGRASLNTYFFNSPINCAFSSNAICLTAYGPIQTQGITGFPYTSWAAKARYAVNDRVYVQTGVFDYNSQLSRPGKNGLDFSLFQGEGVLLPVEIGYQTTPRNDPLPRRYRLGFYLNTDGGTDPYRDINGNSAGLTGALRAHQNGRRAALYALADQTIAVSGPQGARNTAVFGRLFVNAGSNVAADWSAMAGLLKTGTFAGRDRDTIGFFISNTHFSDAQVNYWRDLRARQGGTGSPHQNEIVGELNYGFVPVRGLRLLPNVQYVLNPDPGAAPTRLTNIPSALVLGLRLDVRAADLFGAGN